MKAMTDQEIMEFIEVLASQCEKILKRIATLEKLVDDVEERVMELETKPNENLD
mgnify:CR=1 FL=1